MNKLYVFSSPTQSFIFNRQIAEVDNAFLILVGDKKKRKDIMVYLADYNWKQIYSFAELNDKTLLSTICCLVIVKYRILVILKKNKITDLFIGSINNFIQIIFLSLFQKRGKIHLMTDGMQQIVINRLRNNRLDFMRKLPRVFLYLGLKRIDIPLLHFLTPYKLISAIDKINHVPFKKTRNVNLATNVAGFIGMPVVELGLISLETHLKNLDLINQKFKEQELIYFAHPGESENNLKQIMKNYKVVFLPRIFEEYIGEGKDVPQDIVSYYSSVLLNIHLMSDSFNVFYAKITALNRLDLADSLKHLYEYFEGLSSPKFTEIKI